MEINWPRFVGYLIGICCVMGGFYLLGLNPLAGLFLWYAFGIALALWSGE